jgi:hypothetical protein
MTKFIYLFSLSVALFSFILGTLNSQISLFTCFVRSSIVFLGILFVFSLSGQFLSWIVKKNEKSTDLTVTNTKKNDEEEQENEANEEAEKDEVEG